MAPTPFLLPLLLCLLLLLCRSAAAAAAAPARDPISLVCGPAAIAPYETYEAYAVLPTPLPAGLNVFNHTQLSATASIAAPLSPPLNLAIDGFAYIGYNTTATANGQENDAATTPLQVRWRFTPQIPSSTYRLAATVVLAGSRILSGSCSFAVAGSPPNPAAAGFVRVGPNGQHFALTTGEDYFAVGENLAWSRVAGSATFADYMRNISRYGGNYVRVWLTDSWDDLFIETALGNYSLPNAHHVDAVLAAAAQYGVRVLMCIESFNLFCTSPNSDCDWQYSVYNTANGGFLAAPQDFFTDPRATAYFQQRLRYLVARYAASPSVFAWEFFNEVDITSDFNATIQAAWVQTMAAYIKSIDVYHHPVSTSFCCHDVTQVYSLPVVDFAMTHTYGSYDTSDTANNVQHFVRTQSAEYTKPVYVAECGTAGVYGPTASADPTGISLHNMLWAPVATRGAGTAMSWWWDSWIAPANLYDSFVISNFTRDVTWTAHQWSEVPLAFLDAKNVTRLLATVGAPLGSHGAGGNTTVVLWLQNTNNTFVKQNASHPVPLLPISGLRVTIPGSFNASAAPYTVRWFDTYAGTWMQTTEATCVAVDGELCGSLQLTAPTFTKDLAAWIVSQVTAQASQRGLAGQQQSEAVVPGTAVGAFSIPLLNGSTFSYNPRDAAAAPLPLVVYVHDLNDPFTVAMFSSNDSIDTFLQQNPIPEVHTLIIGQQAGAAAAVRQLVQQRLAVANISAAARQAWQQRLHYASLPFDALANNASSQSLTTVLTQWPTFLRGVTYTSGGQQHFVSRLDGRFQYCNIVARDNHSPSDPSVPWPPNGAPLVLAKGNVCVPSGQNYTNTFVLADMTGASCDPDTVARNIMLNGSAQGVIVMAATSQPLIVLGANSFEDENGLWDGDDNHGFCSVVAYNADFIAEVKNAGASGLSMQYASVPRNGSFMGVTIDGLVEEMGAPLNPDLMLLGWQAQGLEYDAHLKANLTQPALVVPLLTRVVGTAATNIVTLPSSSVLSNFDTLVMEARLSCEGAFDADCDAWDHVITVAAQCQPATCDPTHHNLCEPDIGPHEMGRWITPYRRRVGHWLTDITPWLAVFQGSARCNISFVATDNGHPWVFDLALRFVASGSQSAALRPVQMIPLFNTTVLQTFDNTYNLRPTLTVQTPTAFSAKGAQLVALVTGHGDMEFEPSRHAFVVNNQQFNLSFMEPLNQWGCSDKVREGVEPNGYGGWWYGRDGWCNGWVVRPWVIDVSNVSNLHPGADNTISYRAYGYDPNTGDFVPPDDPGGYMRVTSQWVWLE